MCKTCNMCASCMQHLCNLCKITCDLACSTSIQPLFNLCIEATCDITCVTFVEPRAIFRQPRIWHRTCILCANFVQTPWKLCAAFVQPVRNHAWQSARPLCNPHSSNFVWSHIWHRMCNLCTTSWNLLVTSHMESLCKLCATIYNQCAIPCYVWESF